MEEKKKRSVVAHGEGKLLILECSDQIRPQFLNSTSTHLAKLHKNLREIRTKQPTTNYHMLSFQTRTNRQNKNRLPNRATRRTPNQLPFIETHQHNKQFVPFNLCCKQQSKAVAPRTAACTANGQPPGTRSKHRMTAIKTRRRRPPANSHAK